MSAPRRNGRAAISRLDNETDLSTPDGIKHTLFDQPAIPGGGKSE
jgi:hypothetical protein